VSVQASSGSPSQRAGHLAPRIVARLDIKAPNLVKGIHLEGLRVIGDPAEHALRYYEQGADELLYIDIVASLYGRNSLADLVERTARQVFVPLTVGGGVRSSDDIARLLRAGADKVAINTAAVARPALLTEASRIFGAQCVVLGIEAKRAPSGKSRGSGWEAFTDNGREKTGLDVVEWAKRAVDLGAGEILLTSIDNEGTRKGFDLELVRAVGAAVGVPVVASGGAGEAGHVHEAIAAGADAVAIAGLLHYRATTVGAIKSHLAERGVEVVT
jgi:imidazole glycerol-phosphate synthase subunit HisF